MPQASHIDHVLRVTFNIAELVIEIQINFWKMVENVLGVHIKYIKNGEMFLKY